jgi:hypothetical protein
MEFLERSHDIPKAVRLGHCKVCNSETDRKGYPLYNGDDMRALYVRFAGKFERVGSLYEKCGHVEIDVEKYRMLVNRDERILREKYAKERQLNKDLEGERVDFPPIEAAEIV